MAAKFVVKHRTGHGYHFNLVATNGQVIASSEVYNSKQACMEGIQSVKKNAPLADVVEDGAEAGGSPTA